MWPGGPREGPAMAVAKGGPEMTVASGAMAEAITAWTGLLGPERVLSGDAVRQRFGPGTAPTTPAVPVVLLPTTEAEVQAIVLTARHHRTPLYPVSTGHNWGYGDASPPVDGAAVVDLSGLNRIVEVDAELGLVTLEPGVTQSQLWQYLADHGIALLVPLTGAGGSCSILGNALDRGFGQTPTQDHFLAVTTLRAVLPDGRLYESPLAALGAPTAAKVHKWGLGPYTDGLFSQGHFGIVTQMTIALEPKPAEATQVTFQVTHDHDLTAALTGLQQVVRQMPTALGRILLSSDVHYLARNKPYPSADVPAGGTLSPAQIRQMMGKKAHIRWFGFTMLYGEPGLLAAVVPIMRRELKGRVTPVRAFSWSLVRLWQRLLTYLPAIGPVRAELAACRAFEVTAFEPFDRNLRLAYWRANVPVPEGPLDPGRDGCGVLWYAPIVPFRPAAVAAFSAEAEAICRAHGIEPQMRLVLVSSRQIDLLLPVVFDKRDAASTATAQACYKALFDAGRQHGYLPYRMNSQHMDHVIDPEAPFWQLLADFKHSIDPDDLLSPGRYGLTRRTGPGRGVAAT